MSDILCRWLNQDLRLSKAVEPDTFANDFSSGYLIGEVLHKYQLQKDFSMFMKKDTSISKLNNFTRIEPTLKLLGLSFDVNTAQDLMQEKPGAATRLLHQLYVSLEKNKKTEISGTMMEIMQPVASANLHKKEHEIYSHQLHQVVKRDAELRLQKIPQHYGDKSQQWCDRSAVTHPIQQKRRLKVQEEKLMKDGEKQQVCHQKHSDMTSNQATNVKVNKLPPYTSHLNLKKIQQQRLRRRKEQQAQTVQTEIAQFETNRKKLVTSGFASSLNSSGQPFPADFLHGNSNQGCEVPGSGNKITLQSNSKYIQEIRQRLEENAVACEQRKKRVDRFLVEQFKAHETQEEARREEQLVRRLTRQTRQEQRLTTQLLQMRMQKEVIRENRLFREQQYQQRRERDYQEALERESVLTQQAKLDRAEEIKKELEFCNRIAAERAQTKYKKHFKSSKDVLHQIVDLATKVGEYRLLTGNLIPGKLMREWKELLFRGLPLFEPVKGHQPEFSTQLDPVELKKQETLNNQDYDEYTNIVGEWTWPEEAGETKLPPDNNNILGHVVHRLRNLAHPSIMKTSPLFPHFTIKACVLGKICSGKTTCLAQFAEAHGICVLSTDTLIEEAVNAYKNGEEKVQETQLQEEKEKEQQLTSSPSLKSDLDTQEESKDSNSRLSTRAIHGAAAENELRKGKAIPSELLVDIIVEAIRQIPAQSGWILDGFPVDITQAHLLEKALGGSVDAENEVVNSRTNLAADPNPPKPPPPPMPVLDLAMLLDVPDECVVKRAFSHIGADRDTAAATTCQSTDKNLYLAQIPNRITGFQENWPKLEKWFVKQNILVRVDADVDDDELYSRVESVLQQVMKEPQEAPPTPIEDVVPDSAKPPELSSSATPPPVDQPPAQIDKELSPKESHSSLKGEKVKSVTPVSKSNTHFPKGHSGNESVSSVSSEDSQAVATSPNESSSSCPTSSSQAYVDEPLPSEIPEYLCPYWDELCATYVNNVQAVMQQLRSQRTNINHQLYNIREGYKHYLGRPDLKQELVSQWQKDFNSVPDDMREDEDTIAELHMRLDELLERLWDITDKRKEEDEQERATLMNDGRLEEHTTVLINHHSSLIQVELNRFQKTLCFLSVYYLSMCRQVPPEPPSKFADILLLETPATEDVNESSSTSVPPSVDDGEDKSKIRSRPNSSKGVSETKSQDNTDLVKQPEDKLISYYEEAIAAINKLVIPEAHQGETKEQKEKQIEKEEKEKENEKVSESPKKMKKGKLSAKKLKGPPTPPPAPSPAPPDEKKAEKTRDQEVREKIHKEHAAALNHEGDGAKVRLALVKGHGLARVHSLQSRAEQIFSSMQKWFEAHYLAEMKSIDQLSDVVRHHIESGAKLQNKLVLECSDFYLNGDYHMVPSHAPPPLSPAVETPTQSTPTITQLESLHQKLCNIAPSGVMSSSDFSRFLEYVTSGKMGRNILPEPWMDKNETQVMEIVTLLLDEHEMIDWRRFLLSAALPWPVPSLTQLLSVLQRFRAADAGDTGYIHMEQYLQIELWFSTESVQTVFEDPSEPVPYDRLANLHKFFFQLFADHSFCPPRLDYVSMLQYFAADPNPRQGFIRALSVVLGQHLKHSSLGHLVKSMPRMEEAAEVTSLELNGDYKEEETLCASSSLFGEQEVSISALLAVICHQVSKMKDNNTLRPGCPSQEEQNESLVQLFRELGYKPEDHISFSVLSQQPFIQVLLETSTRYQLVNIHRVLLAHQDEEESDSLTVS